MDSTSDSESDISSHNHRNKHETKRLKYVFDVYFQRMFSPSSNEFMKYMNQRCTNNNDSFSYILLCEAIKRNDNKNAMILIKNYCKANMGKTDPGKDIPLHLATLTGNVEIVEMLLSRGARVNFSFHDKKESLHFICDKASSPIIDETSRIAIAKLLLKHGADVNAIEGVNKDSPLILAVRSRFLKLTQFLLKNGSDRHYLNKHMKSALHIAFSENAGIEMIELLYDADFDLHQMDSNKCKVFAYAVRNLMNSGFGSLGSLNEPLKPIQFLLNHGVSVNSILDKRGNKILHMISQNHAAQTMKIFLDHGAEVNVTNIEGKTPLHYCAENQTVNLIELLLSHGADVNLLTDTGMSVIHFAAANKHPGVLNLLLKYKLDINAKDKDGNFTPLFNAVWSNCYENVKLLLQSKANVNERIINNQIVLHVAVDQKHVEIIKLLLKYGADINIVDDYGNTPLTIIVNQSEELLAEDWPDADSDDTSLISTQCVLTMHVAKLFHLGQYLSEQSLRLMNSSLFVDGFRSSINELTLMKSTQIIEGVTYFDVLTMNRNKLISYIRNSDFPDACSYSNYIKKFLLYFDELSLNFQLAKERLSLLGSATEIFIHIVQNTNKDWANVCLPILIVEHILSYLSDEDLENISVIYDISTPEAAV